MTQINDYFIFIYFFVMGMRRPSEPGGWTCSRVGAELDAQQHQQSQNETQRTVDQRQPR